VVVVVFFVVWWNKEMVPQGKAVSSLVGRGKEKGGWEIITPGRISTGGNNRHTEYTN